MLMWWKNNVTPITMASYGKYAKNLLACVECKSYCGDVMNIVSLEFDLRMAFTNEYWTKANGR